MSYKKMILVCMIVTLLAAGCSVLPRLSDKAVTDLPEPTLKLSEPPPQATQLPIIITATPKNGAVIEASATIAASETSTASTTQVQPPPLVVITNTPVIIPATPSSPSSGQTVKIFLVAISDNGVSGKKFGCDDSLVAVDVSVTPTVAVLRTALNELLSIKSDYYGQSGLYNALYQSNLEIDNLGLKNGLASIYLKGNLVLGGICDNPRVEEQLRATALQFSTVSEVEIFINGKPLAEVLSERG